MSMTAELRDLALRVAGSMDPEVMTGEQAAAAVEDLAVAENALVAAMLFAALRVARTNAWQGQGFASAADWLAKKVGISVYEANKHLGTAKRADRLPRTKKAMKDGDLSADQAGAVSDAATADPDAEDELLDAAKNDTNKDLKEKAARRKAAVTGDGERERRIRRERSVRRYVDGEGAFNLHLRGPAADGARIEALLRPFEEQAFRTGRRDGVRDSFENRSYDAMLAALGLGGPASPVSKPTAGSTEPGTTKAAASAAAAPDDGSAAPTPASVPAKVPGGNNVKVIVTVDHTALLRGHTVAGETCQIAGVGPISVEAVRDILRNDPFLAVVVKKGQDIVNVAHHGRGLNAAQRTAIEATGVRCRNVACNRTIGIQIDHRVPYGTDPITELHNADPLCTACHQLKTHHGHQLQAGTGRRRLLPPDHPDHPRNRPPSDQADDPPAESGEPRRSLRVEQPTLC